MEEKRMLQKVNHNIIMEGRKKLSVSAVEEVGAFDEESVTLKTALGTLTIKGEKLKINKLSVETGDVDIEGEINSCSYKAEEGNAAKGIFSKLFK
ncbi:MAG: sporulation protein YabP [Clostridia bacterium]|nr:sporulation protein YabP [Clostridia bacterium]